MKKPFKNVFNLKSLVRKLRSRKEPKFQYGLSEAGVDVGVEVDVEVDIDQMLVIGIDFGTTYAWHLI
jgi:hypothetical protein